MVHIGAKKRRKLADESRDAAILLTPLIALLLVFVLFPVFSNFYYALTKWKGFGAPEFVGLANFQRLLEDRNFWEAVGNTFSLLIYVPVITVVPLFLAALLREGFKGWTVFRAILFIPNVLGFVVIGMLFNIVLREFGPLNQILRAIGLDGLAVNWLGESRPALHALGLVNVLERTGFGVIYFLASMATIDEDLYAAAKVDGAGWWTTFWNVTVPSIRFAVEFWVILSFIRIFARLFGFIFTLTGGGPGYSTVTLEYGVYLSGFENFQMGYASAWAVVLFLLCAMISVAQIYLIRQRDA